MNTPHGGVGIAMSTDTHPDGDPTPATDAVGLIDVEGAMHNALERDRDDESHRELDPSVFHASSIGYPTRQVYLSKLGLKHHDAETLARFKIGDWIHEFIEDALAAEHDHLELEHEVELDVGDVTFVGRCDAYDPVENVVYDFKSRASWYKFDPPTQRHIDQLLVYMHALGAEFGQVVYVSKKDLEVRTWPEDAPFVRQDYDERFTELVEKAHTIREVIREEGIATRAADIPFEKGSDWISQQEELVGWME